MTIRRVLIIAAILLVSLIAAFSTARTHLQCSGKMSTQYGPRPVTLDVRLERHRLGEALWRDSPGAFWVEMPGELALRYEIRKTYGDLLDLVLGGDKEFSGIYSTSSNQLSVRTPQGLFGGACTDVD